MKRHTILVLITLYQICFAFDVLQNQLSTNPLWYIETTMYIQKYHSIKFVSVDSQIYTHKLFIHKDVAKLSKSYISLCNSFTTLASRRQLKLLRGSVLPMMGKLQLRLTIFRKLNTLSSCAQKRHVSIPQFYSL